MILVVISFSHPQQTLTVHPGSRPQAMQVEDVDRFSHSQTAHTHIGVEEV